ncbi:Dihydrolipoamide acyltransferase [Giardia duodenalis]|uniref:Dihydrolipoamide acyltransferase n=1 Tax=Giardia intestinalis TaxID=5741 RepID=V6U0E1_GIAIN|nr:Dihydrolipoamide acyltransferase [Giardia intestinalis]
MIVCACSACRGSSTRSWRSRHTAISTTRTRSRTPGHRQVQDHRRGVTLPHQMDHYYNEKLKKYRDGTLPIVYGTDGSLHPKSRRHLGAPRGRQKLSIRAALPSHTWLRRPTSI